MVLGLFCYQSLLAQTLEERDVKEMKSKSRLIVKEFEGLLNLISNDMMYDYEIEEIIKNSLDPNNANKLFKESKTIVEDDINPDQIIRRRNTEISNYLLNFNLQYNKTNDFSVNFENIEISDVFYKDNYFVIVTLERSFKSTYGKEGKAYADIKRNVELEVFKNPNGKWTAAISSITAYQNDIIERLENSKVEVIRSSNQLLSLSNELEIEEQESSGNPIDTENLGYDEAYYNIIRDADKAFNEERYDDAIVHFENAKNLKSYDSYNNLMLGRSKRLYDVQKLNSKEFLIDLYGRQASVASSKGELEIAIERNKKLLSLANNKLTEKNIEQLQNRLRAKEDVNFLITLTPDKKLLKEMSKKTKGKTKSVEYDLGIALLMKKMYETSKNKKEIKPILEPLNAILKKEPDFIRARLERAAIYTYLLDYKSAIKDLNFLIQRNENEYIYYIERGRRQLLSFNQEAAIADFEKATEINPMAPEGHFELGKIYLESYRYDQAEYHFKKCLSAQYSNPTYHIYYANSIKNENRLKALDHLKIAGEFDSDFRLEKQIEKELSGILQFSDAQIKNENLDEAKEIIEKALQVNNNSLSALIQKSVFLKTKGYYQEAIPILERLLTINPNSSRVKYELADNYSKTGRLEQSKSLFTQHIESLEEIRKKYASGSNSNLNRLEAYDIELHKNYLGLADLYFNNQKYTDAIEYYNKAKTYFKTNDYTYLKLAQSYFEIGQIKDSQIAINSGLKINPTNSELYFTRGLVFFSIADYNNAIFNFNESVKDLKLINTSNYYLGLTHYKDRNLNEALQHFKEVTLSTEFFELALEYCALIALNLNNKVDIDYYFKALEAHFSQKPQKNRYEALVYTKKLFENTLDENEANDFLKTEPNNARVLYALAVLSFQNNRKENAYSYLEKALRTKQLNISDIFIYPGFGQFEDRRVIKMINDYL